MMLPADARAMAQHVEAAKRLFAALDLQARAAAEAIGRDDGAEFFAAVDERSRVVAELDDVIAALTEEEGVFAPRNGAMIRDLAQCAAAALSSHEELAGRTRAERDRLGVALARVARADAVAERYSGAGARTLSFSVTG